MRLILKNFKFQFDDCQLSVAPEVYLDQRLLLQYGCTIREWRIGKMFCNLIIIQ